MSHNRTALRTEHVDALVPMTIQRSNNNPRTIYSADPSYPYDELLPCLSGCRRVDRKCPVYLGFRCPLRGVTANSSYAYCGRDKESGGDCEGEEDGGADIWGNVWCNGYVDSS
jgi:calcium channel MID1